MNKTSRKIDLLLAFVINIIFVICFVCFYEMIMESNDDLAIAFLLEGAYGERSEYLIYQNVLWGKFMVALYNWMPQIKWYMIVMQSMLFFNFTGITYAFLRMQGRKIGTMISSILVLFCGYHTYVIFQYSRVAAVVTAGGLILMFFALEYAKCKVEKWICIIIGAFMALWGSMIRFPMFAMAVVLVGGSIGLYKVWSIFRQKQEGWLKKIATYVAVFGTVGVISLGLYVVDRVHYTSDEHWAEFVVFNDVRTELWDYGFPDYYMNYEMYQGLGISEHDLGYYWHWNMDNEVLTTEVLTTIAEAKEAKTFSFGAFIDLFPKSFEKISVYVLFLIMAIVAICFDCKNTYYALYGFLGVMIFEAYFFYSGRYGIERVDCPMWVVALLALTYGLMDGKALLREISWKWVAAILAVSVVLNIGDMTQTTNIMSGAVGSTKMLYDEIADDKDHLYVVMSLAPSIYYSQDYWEPCEKGELSNIYNAFGWEQRTKVKEAILDKYNINNIYRDSINNDKVYFITGNQTEMLQTYIRENYNSDAVLVYEKDIFGNVIWSVKTNESL